MNRDRGYHPIYGTSLQPHQNEAVDDSKVRHHWWRDVDGFQKLCLIFNKLLVLKNIFVCKLISCFPYIVQEFILDLSLVYCMVSLKYTNVVH